MAEKTIVVVGPGKTFGAELCQSLVRRKKQVAVLGRHKPGFLDEDHMQFRNVDLMRPNAYLRALKKLAADRPNISGVIFNAASSKVKTFSRLYMNPELLVEDMRVGAAVAITYLGLAETLMNNGGNFVYTGGDYADHPDPHHVGLGVNKAIGQNLVGAVAAELKHVGVGVHNYVISGSAMEQKAAVVRDLTDLVCRGELTRRT